MFRLEGRLEGEPQELDVRIHLLVRDLEGAGFFRRDDRLPDLAGDLLGWADGRLRDLAEERHALPVAFALDRFPRPRHEVGLTVARREEPALDEHRDLADPAVFELAERHAPDLRREEGLANRIADAREFCRVSGPLLEARPVRVVDVFEDLHDVQREDRRFFPSHRDGQERLGTAGREDRRPAEREGLMPLPAVREGPVHELLGLRLEVRGARRLFGGQERPALVTDQGGGGMEQEAIVDEVAALGFDADDGRVGRLVLPIIEGPRVVDLEVEVHRAGFLRLEPELQGHSLVRVDLLDRPESLDFDGTGDDRGDMLRGPVPFVRDVHFKAVPAVRLQPGARRLEEEPRVSVFQEAFDLRFRGRLGPVDQGFGPLQVLEAHRVFRLLEERFDVGEVCVDRRRLGHRGPDPIHVRPRLVEDRPPALAGERFFRPSEVLVHLPRVLLLDRPLDLREVRLRLPDVQVLALRDRDVVYQGRELDLDFLRGDLALLPFEGLVEALLDFPDALVLAFVVRLFRLPEEELCLARVRADPLHLADRVAGRDQDVAHAVSQLGLDQVRLRLRLFDELPRELNVRLQGRLGFGHEFVRLGRLVRAEGVDRHGGERHRAVRESTHVRVRFRRDEHELLDHLVDAFELVQQSRPSLEDVPVPVLDLLQDLEHVEGEELRLLPDDDRREERMRRAFDQDLRGPEIETFHADARARLERVFHEILHVREHAGEDVLVDLIAHHSRKFREEIDQDIFFRKLTVVQDFVKDSFKSRTRVGMKRLDFGDSKILIERSPHTFLATVVVGQEPKLLPLYMLQVLKEVEDRYGNVLEKWTGLLHQLEGVDEMIEKLVLVATEPNADMGALADSPVTLTAMAIDALGANQATEANELMAKAQSTLETDIQLAWQFIEQAKSQADLVKTQLRDRMGDILVAARDTVGEMQRIGADTSQAELLLREAEEAYNEGKYERVREIQQGLHESLERQKGEIAAKKVEVELASLLNDISIAKSQNLDVREAESYLTKIEGAIQKKNARQMDEYLRRAKESLARQRRRTVLDKARADMDRVRSTVAQATTVHADLSDVEALLQKAEDAMRLEDLKGAESLIDRAEATARAKVEGLLKDRYPRLFLETTSAGLQANRWNRFEMNITNKGNWPAEHVTPIVTGPVEVQGLRTIEKIEPNQKESLESGLKPKEAGTMDFDFEVHYTRPLDDGKHQTTDTAVVRVESESGYLVDDGLLFHSTGALVCHESRTFLPPEEASRAANLETKVKEFVNRAFPNGGKSIPTATFCGTTVLPAPGPPAFLALPL